MTPQEPNGPRHEFAEDSDPLLVRPFVLREPDTSGTSATMPVWPSAETWPSVSLTGTHEVLSHRADKREQLSGAPAPARRRRTFVLAGVGAVAVIGLASAGYGMLRPQAGDDVPIPSGALPPQESPSPGDTPAGAAAPGARTRATATATATGRASAKASPPATGRTSPAAVATTPATIAPDAATTIAPAPPAMVAGLAPPAAARVGTIAGNGNLCLDLNGGVPVDDNHVQVFTCNGSGAQRWTLAIDGTLQVVGKCAQVTGDSTVHIIGCDGRAQSQWRADAGGTLVNVATGQCLTDPESGARSGAGVRVTPCAATGNQRWALP
jgi:hypothetical protein